MLLPDDLMVGKPGCAEADGRCLCRLGGNIVCAAGSAGRARPQATASSRRARRRRATEVKGLVEKPPPARRPSRLGVVGRYILQPEVMEILEHGRTRRRRRNPADRRHGQADRQAALPCASRSMRVRHDCGDKAGFVTGQYRAWRCDRDDLAPKIGEFLGRALGLAALDQLLRGGCRSASAVSQRSRISPSSIARVTTRASSVALSARSSLTERARASRRAIRAVSTSKWNGLATTSSAPAA